jgi:hypothetical protein
MQIFDTVDRKFIASFDASDWEVETDTGFQPLVSVSKTVPYDVWTVYTEGNKTIDCADTHIVYDGDMREVFVKDLRVGQHIQTKNGIERVTHVFKKNVPPEHMYDLGLNDANHRFYSSGILSHNSIVVVAWILHYILFNKNVNVGILANKATTANEHLNRLKTAYENLPLWLQQGILSWNKGSIELENGSKVRASPTSASAVRGQSFNCVTGDGVVDILIDGVEQTVTISELVNLLNTDVQVVSEENIDDLGDYERSNPKADGSSINIIDTEPMDATEEQVYVMVQQIDSEGTKSCST